MKCSNTSWYMAVLTLDLRKHSGPTPADDMAYIYIYIYIYMYIYIYIYVYIYIDRFFNNI